MKALVIQEPKSISGLRIIEKKIPEPQKGEIRIKVQAAGLNPSDFQYALFNEVANEERVLGIDVCGVVDKIGNDVNNINVGDRVYYLRSLDNIHGGFAEYAITPANLVSILPKEIPSHIAGVVPGAGFTAYQAIMQKLRPVPGKTILIHGGAGGVGSFAIQFAKFAGLTVISSCLSKDVDYVRSLGADKVIDFTTNDVHEETMKYTNQRGVDYILSTIGSDIATKDLDVLAIGGEIAVTAGFPKFDKIKFYEKGLSIHELALGLALTSGDSQAEKNIKKIGDEVAELIANNKIKPPKITKIKLEEVPMYLEKLKNGEITGKVVAEVYN
ncbi:zinc-binding dehydrogenase [Niallia circulans]|uniref:zinc-binding dehydrogenase n=1 Tax=Niallia circulans TaxID=1397 RepID=UPI00155FA9C2|nr:zinc-binding dehydrogenase [Niallia circulans]NRG33073.1 zinc-binding dehydrogenase [Niallia circulans]